VRCAGWPVVFPLVRIFAFHAPLAPNIADCFLIDSHIDWHLLAYVISCPLPVPFVRSLTRYAAGLRSYSQKTLQTSQRLTSRPVRMSVAALLSLLTHHSGMVWPLPGLQHVHGERRIRLSFCSPILPLS
jgi:hypothetical protein